MLPGSSNPEMILTCFQRPPDILDGLILLNESSVPAIQERAAGEDDRTRFP